MIFPGVCGHLSARLEVGIFRIYQIYVDSRIP